MDEHKKFIIKFLCHGERRDRIPSTRPDSRLSVRAEQIWLAYEELFKDGLVSRNPIPLGWEYFMTPANKVKLQMLKFRQELGFDEIKEV